MPTANSLIADYFTRSERPRAVSRYLLGGPLSLVCGYCLGGWLNEYCGWRKTFVLLGLPGLVLAVVAKLTLLEPRSGNARLETGNQGSAKVLSRPDVVWQVTQQPTAAEVYAFLWHNRTFRNLLLSYSVAAFFGYGLTQWQPTFFIRSYRIGTAELGTWLALIYGTTGFLGMYWGGELASRYAADNERAQLRAMAAAFACSGLLWSLVYISPNQYAALALTGLAALCGGMCWGPLFAAIQTLVPERMRAQSIALIFLFANFVGMGLGPLAVGTLSDALHSWVGDESVRYALLAMCPGYVWAALHLWYASGTVSRDLEVLRSGRDRSGAPSGVTVPSHEIPTEP
jgi:MFS family permease